MGGKEEALGPRGVDGPPQAGAAHRVSGDYKDPGTNTWVAIQRGTTGERGVSKTV